MKPVSEQKPDALTIQLAYNIGLGRQPTGEEVENWGSSGSSLEQLMRTILSSAEHDGLFSTGDYAQVGEVDGKAVYRKK